MGKLQSLVQLGGVFGDFPAPAPAMAGTYLVGWRRAAAARGRPGPAKRASYPGLGPGHAGRWA